jgi:SAM-dependent methyltransferase
MRRVDAWQPSKFVMRRGRLRASSNLRAVGPGSWLITDLTADCYWNARNLLRRGAVLDLGSGTVPLYRVYAGVADSICCVDWPGSVHQQQHVDCFVDLNRGVPFADRVFDNVILSDVLEHIYEHRALLQEIGRVLKPGGVLFMNTPFLYRVHEAPNDHYRYTEFALRRMTAEAGLDIVLLQPVGGVLEVFSDLVAKMLARLPIVGVALADVLQRLTSLLGRWGLARRARLSTGSVFPLAYFVVARRRAGQAVRAP